MEKNSDDILEEMLTEDNQKIDKNYGTLPAPTTPATAAPPAPPATPATLTLPAYKYPEWYNEQQHGFYKKTICRLQKLFKMNVDTAKHYERLNLYIFGPSITITVLTSMAGFLSTTDLLSDDAKTGFGLTVGILSILSTAMQSIAGTCQYKSRSDAFRVAADQYEQLLTRLRFESEMPKTEDFMEKLETEILDVQSKNTYFPPEKISSKYNVNETNC